MHHKSQREIAENQFAQKRHSELRGTASEQLQNTKRKLRMQISDNPFAQRPHKALRIEGCDLGKTKNANHKLKRHISENPFAQKTP